MKNAFYFIEITIPCERLFSFSRYLFLSLFFLDSIGFHKNCLGNRSLKNEFFYVLQPEERLLTSFRSFLFFMILPIKRDQVFFLIFLRNTLLSKEALECKLKSGLGLACGAHFLRTFFNKIFSYLMLYHLTKFHYQTFLSQDIEQHVFLNSCLVNWFSDDFRGRKLIHSPKFT